MATEVQEMRDKLRAVREESAAFAKGFSAENPPNEDDERKLDAMLNGAADLEAAIGRLDKFAQTGGSSRPNPNPARSQPSPAERALASLGARFVQSPEYLSALATYAPDGRIPERGNFKMPPISFRGYTDLNNPRGALVTGGSDTSGGAFIITDRQPGMVALGRAPLRMRDVVTVLQTTSDLVDYVAQTSRTNNAAIVAEAGASGDGSGASPESAIAYVVRQAPVYNVSNWIPVTKQAAADVPQLRGMIDLELTDNLDAKVNGLMVNGTGSGQPYGLLQTTGRQSQAWSTNILTTTRKAKTIVFTVGHVQPEAYILNPSDWETIDLLQDNEARYFYGGPAQVGVPRLWGLPVVEEVEVAAGTGICGRLSKAILWDREQGNVSVSDSHADFFTRGLLAILAELRAAFALTQPNAIVEIDLTA